MKRITVIIFAILFAANFATAYGQQLKTFHYACPGDKDNPEITYTGYEDELGNITKHGQYKRKGITVNFKNGKLDGAGTIAQGRTTATLKYVNDKLVSIDYVEKYQNGGTFKFKYSLDDSGMLKGDFEFKQINSYDNAFMKGQFDSEGKATGWWEFKYKKDSEVQKEYYEHGYCMGTDDKTIETSRAYFIEKNFSEKELHDKGFFVIIDDPTLSQEIWMKAAIDIAQRELLMRYNYLKGECVDFHLENTFNLKNIFNHTSLGYSPVSYMSAELYQNITNQIKNKTLQMTIAYDIRIDKYYVLKTDGKSRLYIPIESEKDFKELISDNHESCGELTDYDGNNYKTVKIGSQCWMKENLRTTHYANGTEITLQRPFYRRMYTSDKASFYCPKDGSDILTHGYLYNWAAVMNGQNSSTSNPSHVQGICPVGWHVPSMSEWNQLAEYTSSQNEYLCNNTPKKIAKALASKSYWYTDRIYPCAINNDLFANNATGFSAIPTGTYCIGLGDELILKYSKFVACFWSTADKENGAFAISLDGDKSEPIEEIHDKKAALSVRCVKD